MPSGSTHDRITLWSLPVVAGLTLGVTRSSDLTLLVSGGFLFSGLMFGPDLDIYSRQFIRWGRLRWIWIPYQKGLRHRSIFSHGFLIGTLLRVIYLGACLGVVWGLGFLIATWLWGWSWEEVEQTARSLSRYYREGIALFIGLELGAMSHSFSDWGNSAYKRLKKKGIQALIPQSTSKKRTSRKKTAIAGKSIKPYNVKQAHTRRKSKKKR